MSKIQTALAMAVMICGVASGADDARARLAVKMRAERSELVKQIAQGWLNGAKKESLRDAVVRLVDVHVRMAAMGIRDSENEFGAALDDLTGRNLRSTDAMVGEVARAYLRRKEGLVVNTRRSFHGVYLVLPRG